MNAAQQKQQYELGFGTVENHRDRSSEAFIAERLTESPTGQIRLMESICERENMRRALRQVRKNKGAPGIDGMTVEELPGYLKDSGRRSRTSCSVGNTPRCRYAARRSTNRTEASGYSGYRRRSTG